MCTVTFVPISESSYFITHSRDEDPNRETTRPKSHSIYDEKVLMPIDVKAGGTWIYATPNRVACLLNGAFEKHQRKPPYNKSRGIVLKESIKYNNAEDFFYNIGLKKVEPFTIIVFEILEKKIYELVWDGNKKHIRKLSMSKSLIWSSSTLYSKEIKLKRVKFFNFWLRGNNPENILNFHINKEIDLNKINILLDNEKCKTTSITQIKVENQNINMNYISL